MSDKPLTGKKIIVLVSNGVDENVMSIVQREMVKTGAIIKTVGTESGLVNSWNNNQWGLYFPVDQQIGQTLGADFDGIIVPSGSRGILKLATNAHAERILASFLTSGKPMAFLGNAVELLAKTNLAKGLKVSGPEAAEPVMTAAGAIWEQEAECISGPLMTGECADVTAFVHNMIAHFAKDMARAAQPAVEVKAAA